MSCKYKIGDKWYSEKEATDKLNSIAIPTIPFSSGVEYDESIAFDETSHEDRGNIQVINNLKQKITRLYELRRNKSANVFEVDDRIEAYRNTIKRLETPGTTSDEVMEALILLGNREMGEIKSALTKDLNDTQLYDLLLTTKIWSGIKEMYPNYPDRSVIREAEEQEIRIVNKAIQYIQDNSGEYNLTDDDIRYLIEDTITNIQALDIKDSRNKIMRMIGARLEQAHIKEKLAVKEHSAKLAHFAKTTTKAERDSIMTSVNQMIQPIDDSYFEAIEDMNRKKANIRDKKGMLITLAKKLKEGKVTHIADELRGLKAFDDNVIDYVLKNYLDDDVVQKAISLQYKNIAQWYKNNTVVCNPSAFDVNLPEVERERHLEDFKKAMNNDYHYNQKIKHEKNLINQFYREYKDMQEYIKNNGLTDEDLFEWRVHNDPFLYYNYRNHPDVLTTEEYKMMETYNRGAPRFIVSAPKDQKYYSKKFKEMMGKPHLREFYEYVFGLSIEASRVLPKDVKNGTRSGFLNRVKADTLSVMRTYGIKAGSGKIADWITSWISDYHQDNYITETDEKGNPIGKIINTKFLDIDQRIEELEGLINLSIDSKQKEIYQTELSALKQGYKTDILSSAEALARTIEHYKHMDDIHDFMLLNKAIVNRARVKTPKGFKEGATKDKEAMEYAINSIMYGMHKKVEGQRNKGEVLKDDIFSWKDMIPGYRSEKKKEAKKIEKRVGEIKDQYKEIIEKKRLGQKTTRDEEKIVKEYVNLSKAYSMLGGKRLTASVAADSIISLSQAVSLGLSPISAINNLTFGKITNFIESFGGQLFNRKELLAAQSVMAATTKNYLSFGKLPSSEKRGKLVNFLEKSAIMFSLLENDYGNNKVTDNFLYAWMKSTDFYIKGESITAMLMHRTIETKNGAKSVWSLLKPDGTIDESQFTLEQLENWNSSGSIKLTQYLQFGLKKLHGNIDPSNPVLFKSNVLGRLVAQFRLSWLSQGVYARWGKRNPNEILGFDTEGRYRTVGNYMKSFFESEAAGFIEKMKDSWSQLDDTGKANMKKNAAEILVLTAILVAALAFRAAIPDDDGWKRRALMLASNLLYRSQQDVATYVWPLYIMDFTRDTIPAINILNNAYKSFVESFNMLSDYESGDYEDGDGLKVLRQIGKNLPVVKGFITAETLTREDIRNYRR